MSIIKYCVVVAALCCTAVPSAAARSAAVFEFELIDTSLEGERGGARADEQARLKRLGEDLRKRLSDSGQYTIVDIGPVAEAARGQNLQSCGGCDLRLAEKVGAELAITGIVQKVSNLILNLTVLVREVRDGKTIAAATVDFRGNNDESWERGLSYLVRNRLLDTPGAAK